MYGAPPNSPAGWLSSSTTSLHPPIKRSYNKSTFANTEQALATNHNNSDETFSKLWWEFRRRGRAPTRLVTRSFNIYSLRHIIQRANLLAMESRAVLVCTFKLIGVHIKGGNDRLKNSVNDPPRSLGIH